MRLILDLEVPSPVVLPRSYLLNASETLTSVTLVGFCDASTRAYAAVVYIHIQMASQHITIVYPS